MYNVSAAYMTAIKKPAIQTRVVGTISGTSFNDDNILKGSLSITNQNSGNDNVQIGTVYIGELSITLRGLNVQRYKMDGMEIVPNFELLLADGVTWERVPLGKYYVGEANHTAAGIVIKAYDAVSKLDKPCPGMAITGTPYHLASYACRACRVQLATDQTTFSTFANGTQQLTLYQSGEGTDIETWRDFMSWLAQTCGCYVTADRQGRIEFRPYTQTVIDTVNPNGRFKGVSFSDFETRYTGLYCTNIEDNTMDYYAVLPDNGLTYSLGENPFLQYGTNEVKQTMRRAVLNKLAAIQYVPFSVTLPEDPAYDLGDVLSFPGGLGDASKLFCVNKYTWNYHKCIKLEGVGQNPALSSAQSKTDKNVAGLASKISGDAVRYYDQTNAEDIEINDGETREILDLRYVTAKATHIDFHAEIKCGVETTESYDAQTGVTTYHDGVISVSYQIGDEPVTEYYPVDTFMDGKHLLHLMYAWWTNGNMRSRLIVRIRCDGCSLTIESGAVRGYLAGCGLVGDEGWDGIIEVKDNVVKHFFDGIRKPFTDSVSVTSIVPDQSTVSENIQRRNFASLLKPFRASMGARVGHQFDVLYSSDEVTLSNAVVQNGKWVVNDHTERGFVTTPVCTVSQIAQVASLCSGTDVVFIVSFDEGETWWTFDEGDWTTPDYTQDVYGMFETTMREITAAKWAEKLNGTIKVQAILVENAALTNVKIITNEYE